MNGQIFQQYLLKDCLTAKVWRHSKHEDQNVCLERVIGRRFILMVVMLLMLLMLLMLWVMAVMVMVVGCHLSLTMGTLGILCLQAVGHTEGSL
jgi:hypothetical protein